MEGWKENNLPAKKNVTPSKGAKESESQERMMMETLEGNSRRMERGNLKRLARRRVRE